LHIEASSLFFFSSKVLPTIAIKITTFYLGELQALDTVGVLLRDVTAAQAWKEEQFTAILARIKQLSQVTLVPVLQICLPYLNFGKHEKFVLYSRF
jgi:hypothetical protein